MKFCYSVILKPTLDKFCWHVTKNIKSHNVLPPQPGSTPLIHQKVLLSHISLSRLTPRDNNLTGTLLIHNLSFEKRVFVRYSTDRWLTESDLPCSYLQPVNSQIDLFQFQLVLAQLNVGLELEFCLCFRTGDGTEFWDNNYCRNYRVEVVEGVRHCEVSLADLGLSKVVPSVSPYW